MLIALGFWWNSNTIAHYFVHLPFFRQRFWNRFFSAYQTLLLGVPQRLWRDRHLAHHADVRWRLKWSGQLICEAGLVLALWTLLASIAPKFFLTVYVPGYALGLCLCFLQGYFEHAHGTTSHYSRLYNSLFLNDGYHVEHHAHPSAHWSALPRGASWTRAPVPGPRRSAGSKTSILRRSNASCFVRRFFSASSCPGTRLLSNRC